MKSLTHPLPSGILDLLPVMNMMTNDEELLEAILDGEAEKCAQLLEHGADANAADKNGRTVQMQAAREGHAEICRMLLESGADVNAQNEYGETALMAAMDRDHAETCGLLKAHGAQK